MAGVPNNVFGNRIPLIMQLGDSTTYGVGASVDAGFRQTCYVNCQAAGVPYLAIGSINFAGAGNGLAINPWNEGTSGITSESLLTLFNRIQIDSGAPPDIVQMISGVNSLNPTIGNETPATLRSTWSAMLDAAWALRWCAHYQIVIGQIFRTQTSFDNLVQQANAGLATVIASKAYAANVTELPSYGWQPNNVNFYANGDQIHPNDAGYRIIGANMALALAPVIKAARGN